MDKKIKNFNLHTYIGTLLLCFAFLTYIIWHYEFKVNQVVMVMITVLWIFLVRLFDEYKKTPIPYVVAFIVVVLLSGILIRSNILTFSVLSDYYQWLQQNVSVYGILDTAKEYPRTFIYLSLGLIFLGMIVIYLLNQWFLTRILLAMGIVVLIPFMMYSEAMYPHFCVSCMFAYVVLAAMEASIKYMKIKRSKSVGVVLQHMLPFLLVFFLGIVFLPTSEKPMEWKAVKSAWSTVVKYSKIISSEISIFFNPPKEDEYNISFAGYSENGKLGYGVKDNYDMLTIVSLNYATKRSTYLVGNIKNEFTQDAWIDSLNRDEIPYQTKDYQLDLMELLYAYERSNQNVLLKHLVSSRELTVEYNKLETRSLFYPLKTLSLSVDKDYDSSLPSITFDRIQGFATRYSLSYFEMNLGSDYFKQFIKENEGYQYDEDAPLDMEVLKNHLLISNIHVKLPNIHDLAEELKSRELYIHNNFESVPESISERTYELAENITKDVTSNYEKMLAIEEYLDTYTYTTMPKRNTTDANLIEYFLFDSKEGYCTYFATAMAILGRCVGIPTRYVQGFCVPSTIFDSNRKAEVIGSQAHAWVEAYIDGIGWIPFEPTPSYSNLRYSPWSNPIQSTTQSTTSLVLAQEEVEVSNETLQTKENEISKEEEIDDAPIRIYKSQEVMEKINRILQDIVRVIVVIIVTGIVYILFQLYRNKRMYQLASNEKKIQLLLHRMFFLYAKCGYVREQGETLQQFSERFTDTPVLSEIITDEIVDNYQRYYYNEEPVTDEMCKKMEESYRLLLNHLKVRFSRLKFYYIYFKMV